MSGISCILYPPTVDFNYLVQRPQQLMKSLSALNIPVYYINPGNYSQGKPGIERFNPYLYIFNNVEPDAYLHNVNPVVYYSATSQVDLVNKYHPSLLVFDSVDEPSEEFASWKPYYHRAVSTADVVLATSDRLYSMAREINPHTYLVPNGCDYDYFSLAGNKNLPVPHDMMGITGPIIGYIGAIASWCDLNLIERMAAEHPDWNIVMIGPLYNIVNVPRRPNIHWVGFKTYESLSSYLQLFDVGIIPFKKTSMTASVNPIKMWEYMAAGIPVVSTAIPEVKKYANLVYYSENEEDFIQNILRAFYEDVGKSEQRRALARENSWLIRAHQIVQIIENRLAEKGYINQEQPAPIDAAHPYNPAVYFPSLSRILKTSNRVFRYSTSSGGSVAAAAKETMVPAGAGGKDVRISNRRVCKISTGELR